MTRQIGGAKNELNIPEVDEDSVNSEAEHLQTDEPEDNTSAENQNLEGESLTSQDIEFMKTNEGEHSPAQAFSSEDWYTNKKLMEAWNFIVTGPVEWEDAKLRENKEAVLEAINVVKNYWRGRQEANTLNDNDSYFMHEHLMRVKSIKKRLKAIEKQSSEIDASDSNSQDMVESTEQPVFEGSTTDLAVDSTSETENEGQTSISSEASSLTEEEKLKQAWAIVFKVAVYNDISDFGKIGMNKAIESINMVQHYWYDYEGNNVSDNIKEHYHIGLIADAKRNLEHFGLYYTRLSILRKQLKSYDGSIQTVLQDIRQWLQQDGKQLQDWQQERLIEYKRELRNLKSKLTIYTENLLQNKWLDEDWEKIDEDLKKVNDNLKEIEECITLLESKK